jgi:hypothetical protein
MQLLQTLRHVHGADVPVNCFAWKSYKLPRVVSSTLSGEAKVFATASGVCANGFPLCTGW